MAFLVIAGVTVNVAPDGANDRAPEEVGSSSRAYEGNLRSTVRAIKRVFQFTTKPITLATESTLRAAIALQAPVTMTGDVIGGASMTVRVQINDSAFVLVSGGFRKKLQITAREV